MPKSGDILFHMEKDVMLWLVEKWAVECGGTPDL
jgi:hypothetical protein